MHRNVHGSQVSVVFSSPEPSGSQGELVIYPCSGIRPQCSIIFKTAWPIKVKLDVKHPWVGGTKVCSGNLGGMTKIAAMPIYMYCEEKKLQKSSSLELNLIGKTFSK